MSEPEERLEFEGIAEVYALSERPNTEPHFILTTLGALRHLGRIMRGDLREEIENFIESKFADSTPIQITDTKVRILFDE